MRRIKFAIIGTSQITESFLSAAGKVEDFELVAVYSRSLEKAREFGKKYNAKLFFDSIEKMVESKEIEAVYIASPNAFHAEQAIICLKAGKHVLCEKPMASNSKEVKEMIKTAKDNSVLLMEAMKPTLVPNFKAIRNNLYKIGKIRRCSFTYCQYSSRYDKYKEGIVLNAFKRELSNGALMDIGVYCLYSMISLFGKPKSIKADAIMLDSGVDGQGTVMLNYGNMNGVVQYSKISDSYMTSEIQGEEGSIIIDKINCPTKITIKGRNSEDEVISLEQSKDEMMYEIQEFINLIKNNKFESEINSHKVSLEVSEVMEEVRGQIGLVYPADKK